VPPTFKFVPAPLMKCVGLSIYVEWISTVKCRKIVSSCIIHKLAVNWSDGAKYLNNLYDDAICFASSAVEDMSCLGGACVDVPLEV